jgi:hypothetical protein
MITYIHRVASDRHRDQRGSIQVRPDARLANGHRGERAGAAAVALFDHLKPKPIDLMGEGT